MAALGCVLFERGYKAEGFLIVTAAADKWLVDIHDRRPLVLSPKAAREWIRQDVGGKEAEYIVADGTLPAVHFIWRPASSPVGNVKKQGPELILDRSHTIQHEQLVWEWTLERGHYLIPIRTLKGLLILLINRLI